MFKLSRDNERYYIVYISSFHSIYILLIEYCSQRRQKKHRKNCFVEECYKKIRLPNKSRYIKYNRFREEP